MRDKFTEEVRISHIKEAIDYIKQFTAEKTVEEFTTEHMMRFAVERQLEIIGEASNHISSETKALAPNIEWKKIKSFRNISVHEYHGIDPVIVANIVFNDIPILEAALPLLLKNQ
jgi:uncharacterized protein with HEPN domain